MAEMPIVRVGDKAEGTCTAHQSPRHFIATWTQGSNLCTVDGLGLIRVGDKGVTDCGHNITAVGHGIYGDIEGRFIHRVGDAVVVDEGGTGVSTTGSETSGAL